MKNPPSASVSPPIHTTQRVPTVSSKPRSGCGNGGAATLPAACSDVSDEATGATDSTTGTRGGGVGVAALGAGGRVRSNASNGVSGGGTEVAAAAGAAWIASRRWRSSATWFMAFRAKTRATIAITSAKKTKGSSNIWPPGGRVKALTGHVRSLVAILCAPLSAKSSNQAREAMSQALQQRIWHFRAITLAAYTRYSRSSWNGRP